MWVQFLPGRRSVPSQGRWPQADRLLSPLPTSWNCDKHQIPDLYLYTCPTFFVRIKISCFYFTWFFFFNRFLKKRMPPQPKIDTYVTKNYTFPSHITAGRWYLLFNFSTHILKKILPENIFNQKVNILLMITYK